MADLDKEMVIEPPVRIGRTLTSLWIGGFAFCTLDSYFFCVPLSSFSPHLIRRVLRVEYLCTNAGVP